LFYSFGPRGAAKRKFVPRAVDDEVLRAVAIASARHPLKTLLVVGAEKLYEHDATGVRARSPYYKTRLSIVDGWAYIGGNLVAERRLWSPRRGDRP
jgi:hypothetical protein